MDVILLDELSSKIDSLNSGITSTINNINTNVNSVKAVVDTVNANVNIVNNNTVTNNSASATGTLSQKLSWIGNSLIGATSNTGGTSTAGTVMAKLNAIISGSNKSVNVVYDNSNTNTTLNLKNVVIRSLYADYQSTSDYASNCGLEVTIDGKTASFSKKYITSAYYLDYETNGVGLIKFINNDSLPSEPINLYCKALTIKKTGSTEYCSKPYCLLYTQL